MEKVVGSSPIIRFAKPRKSGLFSAADEVRIARSRHGVSCPETVKGSPTSMSEETTHRVTADVMSGRDPKTPLIALTGVATVVAVLVIVVLALAFVIPRLVTGHWPL
jgi:hypothetical protein